MDGAFYGLNGWGMYDLNGSGMYDLNGLGIYGSMGGAVIAFWDICSKTTGLEGSTPQVGNEEISGPIVLYVGKKIAQS